MKIRGKEEYGKGCLHKKLTRVERLIRDAFADLLEEKEFSEIKVTDIIQKADVSRSAFCSHYEDKFDIINQIERELLGGFVERMQQVRHEGGEYQKRYHEEDVTGVLESAYFRYIAQERRWWTLFMTGRGRSDFVQRFTHRIVENPRLIAGFKGEVGIAFHIATKVTGLDRFTDILQCTDGVNILRLHVMHSCSNAYIMNRTDDSQNIVRLRF